jgi:acyl-coenzyme A thioesterase PaaI-like protein
MQTTPGVHPEVIRQVPEGFTPTKFRIPVPFVELVGPTWMRVLPDGAGAGAGAWVGDPVRNGGNMAHGGYLLTLADIATVRAANTTLAANEYVLPVNLSMGFYAPALLAAWVEARARVERKGRSMIFSTCNFYVGDENIGHASAGDEDHLGAAPAMSDTMNTLPETFHKLVAVQHSKGYHTIA